jgi:hypothetical protein
MVGCVSGSGGVRGEWGMRCAPGAEDRHRCRHRHRSQEWPCAHLLPAVDEGDRRIDILHEVAHLLRVGERAAVLGDATALGLVAAR